MPRRKPGQEPGIKGRPPKEIDRKQLAELGAMHATYEEAAAVLGFSRRWMTELMKDPELLEVFESGKHRGKLSLRRLQWRHAQGLDRDGNPVPGSNSGAVNMTKHLSAHWLGETDNAPSTVVNNNAAVQVNVSVVRERLAAKFDALSQRIQGGVVKLADTSGAQIVPREPVEDGD